MPSHLTNEFRSGLKIMVDGEPHVILGNEFVKPGKGQAFSRVKLRNLITQRVVDRTYKSGESVEGADVMELDLQYLYNDGDEWHFMNPGSYDQHAAPASVVGDARHWLKEQDKCEVVLYNGTIIAVEPPNFVELKVAETEPGVRGDTATGGVKQALLETGATIKVPLFVEPGETLRVNTRTGEYIGRVK